MAWLLDRIAGWGMVAIGAVHCFYTPRAFPKFGEPALWFFAAGLALLYAGALHLLRIRYGGTAAGLRRVAAVVDLSMLAFVLTFAGRKWERAIRDPASVLLVCLVGLAAWFSVAAVRSGRPSR